MFDNLHFLKVDVAIVCLVEHATLGTLDGYDFGWHGGLFGGFGFLGGADAGDIDTIDADVPRHVGGDGTLDGQLDFALETLISDGVVPVEADGGTDSDVEHNM